MLAAARDLIWKQGYCSVTIDAICAEARVRKGSFYYFFDSKSDLAARAFGDLWESVKPRFDEIFSARVPAIERFRDYFRFIHQNQNMLRQKYGHVVGCPFATIGAELSQRDEEVWKNSRAVLTIVKKYFESTLRDAVSEGSIEATDIPALARRLSAYIGGCLLQARVQNNLAVLRDLEPGALELIGFPVDPQPAARPTARLRAPSRSRERVAA
jgi:TetR/AcrR family transcriptional repressor of nem operon